MKQILLPLWLCLVYTAVVAQPTAASLDAYFRDALEAWDIPGFSIGIVKDDSVFLAKGYGVLEKGRAAAVDAHSLFAIASNTKAFVSTALGILVQEGKLKWDDPVQKYLPVLRMQDDWVSAHLTVRDLLCHRSGLGTFSGDVNWYKNKRSPAELIPVLREISPAFDFRSGYGYSNLMFIMAGEVIRTVSGLPWDEFVKQRILTPLEMKRTVSSIHQLRGMTNIATPHRYLCDSTQAISWTDWDNMGAAGGLISSAADMCRWMRCQLNKGVSPSGDTLFSRSIQLDTWSVHNGFVVQDAARDQFGHRQFSGYGLGWQLSDYYGQMVVSHGGGYDGMYSRVVMVPGQRLGIVVLTNSMKGISTWLAYEVLDRFLGAAPKDWMARGLESQRRSDEHWQKRREQRIQAKVHGTSPFKSSPELAGLYRCPMYGEIHVRKEQDGLYLDFADAPDLNARLSHWHYDTYRLEWLQTHAWFDFGTVQFKTDNNGRVTELLFDVPNDDIFFEEIKAKRVDPPVKVRKW